MRDAVRVRDFQLGPDYTDTAYEYRHGLEASKPSSRAVIVYHPLRYTWSPQIWSEGGTRK